MQNVFKPFGAKATGSFEQQFNRALIRLTILYALTLAVILFISSGITYSTFSSRLGRRFDIYHSEGIVELVPRPLPTPDELRGDLIESLIGVNISLLILAGVLSYWLAKVTLGPIKEAYEQQQRFLSDASHELRTPLSILQAELENELARPNLAATTRAQSESKLEEVARMNQLVNDLLFLSRLDEKGGSDMAVPTAVNLTELVNRIFKRLHSVANVHKVHLTREGAEEVTIMTQEDLVTRALTNLVQNAVLYNKEEGQVVVSLIEKVQQVQIIVKDTGLGMSKEDLQKIFQRFYRSDKSRSRQSGGSGLGLSIVRSAVEHLGGTIHLESELEKGTTVVITLPKK